MPQPKPSNAVEPLSSRAIAPRYAGAIFEAPSYPMAPRSVLTEARACRTSGSKLRGWRKTVAPDFKPQPQSVGQPPGQNPPAPERPHTPPMYELSQIILWPLAQPRLWRRTSSTSSEQALRFSLSTKPTLQWQAISVTAPSSRPPRPTLTPSSPDDLCPRLKARRRSLP